MTHPTREDVLRIVRREIAAVQPEAEQTPDTVIVEGLARRIAEADVPDTLLNRRILALDPAVRVILITGRASVSSATRLIKEGAFDYLPKPFTPRELKAVLSRALKERRSEGDPGDSKGPTADDEGARKQHENS